MNLFKKTSSYSSLKSTAFLSVSKLAPGIKKVLTPDSFAFVITPSISLK